MTNTEREIVRGVLGADADRHEEEIGAARADCWAVREALRCPPEAFVRWILAEGLVSDPRAGLAVWRLLTIAGLTARESDH